jgi:hypothetical protein
MRTFLLASFLLVVAPAAAQAQYLKMEVTYTDGHIISGPLTADLTELPEFVHASFLLNGSGAGVLSIADVVEASLAFGDVTWNASDLESFSTTLTTDGDERFVTALTYEFAPKSTSAVNDRISGNFPLEITGTDIASGEEFHYLYNSSTQTVTEVPEPSTLALVAVGVVGFMIRHRRSPTVLKTARA